MGITGHYISSQERVYNDSLTLFGQAFQRNIKSGCELSPGTGLRVNVAAGEFRFGGNTVAVSPQVGIFAPNVSGEDRYDELLFNSAGNIAIVAGTASSSPVPPVIDWDNYALLARVLVQDAATQITTSDIKDMRVVATAVGGGGGGSSGGFGGLGRYSAPFTTATTLTVTHNLGDLNPDVIAYGSDYQMFLPQTIQSIDTNTVRLDFSTSVAGVVSVFGGAFSATGKYTKSFFDTSTVTVNHALQDKLVLTKVYDQDYKEIEPATVTLIDNNSLRVDLGLSTSGVVVVAGGAIGENIAGVKRYSEMIVGSSSYIIGHNLNSTSPQVSVYDVGMNLIYPDVQLIDENNLRVIFSENVSTSVVEVQGGYQTTVPGAGTGDMLPNITDRWDIGSGTYRWKDGYFNSTVFHPMSTAPASISKGKMYFDEPTSKLKLSIDGSTFTDIVAGGALPIGTLLPWCKTFVQKATRTNTSVLAGKLVDSSGNFVALGITAGMYIHDVTDNKTATITSVDSATQLTLDTDIFLATAKTYKIYLNVALGDTFVECNGQTLVDAQSPYNGSVIPNLNAYNGVGTKRFLRGSITSGTVAGADTHSHGGSTGSNSSEYPAYSSGRAASVGHSHTVYSDSFLPSYYEVVWIMKVK